MTLLPESAGADARRLIGARALRGCADGVVAVKVVRGKRSVLEVGTSALATSDIVTR